MLRADSQSRLWAKSTVKPRIIGEDNANSRRSVRTSVRENFYVVRDKPTRNFMLWKRSGAGRAKPQGKFTKWQLFNIVRRLVVIAAAIQYINISLLATFRTMEVLRAMPNPTQSFGTFTASLILGYTGDGLIHDSPLVKDVLGGDTTPRDYVIFLESDSRTSTSNCSEVPLFNSKIYNYKFLRGGYVNMVKDTSYNASVLEDLELVVVVVDCTLTQLVTGDPSSARSFNLVRSRQNPTELYLVTVSLSVQDYKIPKHRKAGPALLGRLTVVNDIGGAIVEQFYMVKPAYPYQRTLFKFEIYEFIGITSNSFLELRSIPEDPLTQPVKQLVTSRNRGLYDGENQSNTHSMYSLLDTNAKYAVSQWDWFGETLSTDSWAWVHGLHFFIAMQTISSLIVLFLVTYQNICAGKFWLGDPFASMSTATIVGRGVLVVISWYLNSFWTLFEFAMSNAAVLSGTETIRIHKELVHADLLVVYLGVVGYLSSVIHERIDPAVAIFLFEIIHTYRLSFIEASPEVLREVVTYSDSVFQLGKAELSGIYSDTSPMRFWSSFQIPTKNATFLAASFFPKVSLLTAVIAYGILRKLYRRVYPEPIHQRSRESINQSANEKTALALKGHLTNFEISTGAELQTRFGIISDYKNYVYFKGMKFASADGVYCSGYVIVNGKFLVKSKSLLAIAMIKLVRARFTNVYAYEVDGNTVKETARLVYPETFTWSDLWCLNVTILL